jgi:hypothetical protein
LNEPPLTTTDVAEPAQPVRNTKDHDLRPKTSRPSSYEIPSSSDEDRSEDNDEAKIKTTKDVGHAQDDKVEVSATDITHSPELNPTLPSAEIDSPGELHIPRDQPTFAHDPPDMLLDQSTLQSTPVPDQKASKRSRISDGTDVEKPPLKKQDS